MGDPNKDADVTNDKTDDPYTGNAGPIRIDAGKDIPVISDPIAIWQSGNKFADEGEWGELAAISGNAGSLAASVVAYAADPLNFLISAGLTFLIDVIQPLDDALGYVTGNPERMDAKIKQWERVANALQPLSEDIRTTGNQGLITWEGEAAEAAKKRINKFADGVQGIQNDTSQLMSVYAIAKVVMETAQGLVIGLIATFVEWMIFTWIPALAAAAPTFGASVATATTTTGLMAARMATRVGRVIQKISKLLIKLRRVLYRMHPRIMRRVQTNFQLRNNGRFTSGWVGSSTALQKSLQDWRTYLAPLAKLPGSVGQEADKYDRGSNEKSTDGLDPSL